MQRNEKIRLEEARGQLAPWKKWGPYLSERQWGTVREDYSENGDAWNYFTHDQARSRAYRWGEDGLAGISDDKQRLCFALALWNERDPILKERLFGLTNSEGNHGEDVKEYYFYLDSTPTHSYMKYLYKYPQAAYPYDDLVDTNRRPHPEGARVRAARHRRLRRRPLLRRVRGVREGGSRKTSSFASPCTIAGRKRPGSTSCRRSGSATPGPGTSGPSEAAACAKRHRTAGTSRSRPRTTTLGDYWLLCCDGAPRLLFTENETNAQRLWGRAQSVALRQGRHPRLHRPRANGRGQSRAKVGTKAAAHYPLTVAPGGIATVRLRLSDQPLNDPQKAVSALCGKDFESVFKTRLQEADEFYARITPGFIRR